jgi:hypothetical protein
VPLLTAFRFLPLRVRDVQGGPFRALLMDIFAELGDIAIAIDDAVRTGKSDPGLCGGFPVISCSDILNLNVL